MHMFMCVCVPTHLRWRTGLIGGLATMESVMINGDRWFTPEQNREFQVGYLCYRSCHNKLAERSIQAGDLLYHCRPKQHMLGHLTFQFCPRNPRYFSNYSDEDMVGRTKRVAMVCHPVHTSRLTLLRYCIQACLKFSGQ